MNLVEIAALYPELYVINARKSEPTINIKDYLEHKHKPNAKLTVYLDRNEYKNKELTQFLRKIIVDGMKITPELVGFAAVKNPFPSQLLAENPTKIALLFGDFLTDRTQMPSNVHVYEVPSLAQMFNNQEKKREAWITMKQFLNMLKN